MNTAPTFIYGLGTQLTDLGGVDSGRGLLIQPDGRILVFGSSRVGLDTVIAIVRYNADGSLDTDFGNNGSVKTDIFGRTDQAVELLLLPDGRFVVLANESTATGAAGDIALLMYNADGSLDTTFGTGGIVTSDFGRSDSAHTLEIQSDGGILVIAKSSPNLILARYDADGTPDTTFGGGSGNVSVPLELDIPNSSSTTVTLQSSTASILPGGKILVAGSVWDADNFQSNSALARYNSDGSPDTTFGGGDGYVVSSVGENDGHEKIVLQPDGSMFILGSSSYFRSSIFTITKHTENGVLDTSFGGSGFVSGGSQESASDIAVLSDGRVLVGGYVGGPSSISGGALFRYNTDGTRDTTFGVNGVLSVFGSVGLVAGFILQPDGTILVTGSSGGDVSLTRLLADGSVDETFAPMNSLDGVAHYVEDSPAVRLDLDARILDLELDALNGGNGDYAGASLVLVRADGAETEDRFGFRNPGNDFVVSGNNLLANGLVFATFTQTNGILTIEFTSDQAPATTALVHAVMGAITYRNDSEFPPDSVDILWTFSDGNSGAQGTGGPLSATGTTSVNITNNNIIGTDLPETLTGGADAEDLYGFGGADILDGMAGNDDLFGGSGDDKLFGSQGDDRLFGGPGADQLDGGTDKDTASYQLATTGVRVDLLFTGSGGEAEGDTYDSIEDIIGTEFADTLLGTNGANVIVGLAGDDRLIGRAGNDTLIGASGNDTLIGGQGMDAHFGGAGHDTASYELASVGLRIDLLYSGTNTWEATGDTYDLIENIAGTKFGDTILGDNGGNDLFGFAGADRLLGRGGNDRLYGGSEDDVLIGGAGGDFLNGGAGVDTASYELATIGVRADLFFYGQNMGEAAGDSYGDIENLRGSSSNDVLLGNGGSNVLSALDGNDRVFGRGGSDALFSGIGADRLAGGFGGALAADGAADIFFVTNINQSTVSALGRDTITDFSRSDGDKINLSAIDANTTTFGNQAFAFIGNAGFSGTAGQLRYAAPLNQVQGDIDGDGAADFAIVVDNMASMLASDFDL